MKVAVVGSRGLSNIALDKYISHNATEIVSGGAVGIDRLAADFARAKRLKLTEFFPEYKLYGRAAPIIRNKKIVDYSDRVIVLWDGKSRGALSVIKYAEKTKKPLEIILLN